MSIRDELEALNARWLEAFVRGDLEAAADCFTEDAGIYSPYALPAIGRAAVLEAHRAWLDAGETNKKLTVLEAGGAGDVGYLLTAYSGDYPTADGGSFTESGKVLNVCRRGDDGIWRYRLASMTSDKPPLAAGA